MILTFGKLTMLGPDRFELPLSPTARAPSAPASNVQIAIFKVEVLRDDPAMSFGVEINVPDGMEQGVVIEPLGPGLYEFVPPALG